MSNLTKYQQKTIFRQDLTNVMLAGSLFMSAKMNNNLVKINSLMNQSLRIQSSIDAGVKQLNVQMSQLVRIAKYQTLLLQKQQAEQQANKMMRETFFYLYEEIEEHLESDAKPIEKYFNLLSIKASMIKNDVSTEMVESFADKKMIKDCYKTLNNEMPKLEKKFSKDDKKLAEQLFNIIQVDEEKEIEKLSSSKIRLFHKIMSRREETVELLCKKDPCVLFSAFWDYDDRLEEVTDKNWKVNFPTVVGRWMAMSEYKDSFQDSMDISMFTVLGADLSNVTNNEEAYAWKWYLTEFIPRLYKVTNKDFVKELQKNYLNNWDKNTIFFNYGYRAQIGGTPKEDSILNDAEYNYKRKGFLSKIVSSTPEDQLNEFKEKKSKFLNDKEVIKDANKCKDYILKAFHLEDKELNLKAQVLKDDKKIKELKEEIKKEKIIIKDLSKKHSWLKTLFEYRI